MISLERLQRFPFFAFMDDKELKAVATIAQELQFQAGDVICVANAPADALYFLTEGNIAYYMVVTTDHMPDYKKEYFIGEVNPQEIAGISALIEPYRFTATLRAEGPCRLIKIDASGLRALCEVDAHLSIGLMKSVAKAAMERLEMARIQLVAQMAENNQHPIK